MIDPWIDPHDLVGEIEPRRLYGIEVEDEPEAREALRCDVCRALVGSLPALLDHYDRRH